LGGSIVAGSVLQYLNHASVLVRNGRDFLLTDPRFEQPAFGSWLPLPPLAIHPAYLVALARSEANLAVLVSHGHDDHLDDELLRLFAPDTPVVIPQFESRGLRNRISKLGFTSVIEIGREPTPVFSFELASHIHRAVSLDDAICSIAAPDALVIHANDNRHEIDRDICPELFAVADVYPRERILYMSQCNLADGFPFIYEQFSEAEQQALAERRIDAITRSSLLNATRLRAGHFLNYAGHATVLVRSRPDLRTRTTFLEDDYIRARVPGPEGPQVLELRPGDTFDFTAVTPWMGSPFLDRATIRSATLDYYDHYGRTEACDTFRYEKSLLTPQQKRVLMERFLLGLETFVGERVSHTGFQQAIRDSVIGLADAETGVRVAVKIGSGLEPAEPCSSTFTLPGPLMDRMLMGEINWENCHTGFEGTVTKQPATLHNGHIIRWLTMYGYFYQQRLARKHLADLSPIAGGGRG
jgi:hypothetical protein